MKSTVCIPRSVLFHFNVFRLAGMLLFPAALGVEGQTGPVLEIQATTNNQVQLFWQPLTGFEQLQWVNVLGLTNDWQIVTNPPLYQAPLMSVTQPMTNAQSYFRLGASPQPNPPPATVADPQTIAPPAPTNSQLSFAAATAFLYSGSNTAQFGVLPGAISTTQAAVLRGRVIGQNGAPMAGVHVYLPGQIGSGYTYTRSDGSYDMAVNGGALLNLDYQLAGYCPVQRQMLVLKQGFTHAPDVILTALDPAATPIAFGPAAPSQWAAASPQTDSSGTRAAKLYFPPGTSALLTFPDGSTQPATNLTIRVTEFTVGGNGPTAMPAKLPPSSHYTYCADFTADEALAAGAQTVNFSQPLYSYLTNYLAIPVGVVVPNGYYNRTTGAWQPLDNGLVIELAGVSNGLAEISLGTNGALADAGLLATNGFTTNELTELATAFPVGATLWRVPMNHFSAQDRNFPPNPGNPANPQTPANDPNNPNDDSDLNLGTLRTVRQVFEESLPLTGAPFNLHYSSARVPDYRVNSQVHFPIIIPSPLLDSFAWAGAAFSLSNVQVTADMAGITNEVIAPSLPSGAYVTNIAIPWNHSWAYGGSLPGANSTIAQVSIDFHSVYDGPLFSVTTPGAGLFDLGALDTGAPLFSQYASLTSEPVHNGSESVDVLTSFTQTLTDPDHRAVGFGGWSITPQHYYDPVGQILYLGDGTVQQSPPLADSLTVAEDFANRQILGVAPAADGSCYVFLATTTGQPNQIVHYIPNQPLQPVTGGGGAPSFNPYTGTVGNLSAYGYPATNAALETPGDLIVGPDNTLYFTQYNGGDTAIWHIDQQGLLHPMISGGPYNTFQPDGAYGTNDLIFSGNAVITMGPDGSIYYVEGPNTIQTTNASWNGRQWNLIRRLAPDGRIYTVAGGGGPTPEIFQNAFPGDGQYVDLGFGQPAASSQLQQPKALCATRDGSIYWMSSGDTSITPFINRITPTGLMESVAQYPVTFPFPYGLSLVTPFDDDGVPVAAMPAYNDNDLYTIGSEMSEGLDGSIYFSTENGFYGNACDFIWQIAPDGIIRRVAGEFQGSLLGIARNVYFGVGGPAQTRVGSDGTLYAVRTLGSDFIGDGPFDWQLLAMSTRTPTVAFGDITIASQDASELYIFDASGHHLRTVDTLTGAIKWQFSYDANNLVTSAQDINGLVTTISRDGAGKPQAITGPYGQTTTLAVDADGFLQSMTDPAGNTTKLANSSGGLLQSITGPRGFTYTAGYDSLGRCVSASDPAGGGESLGLVISNDLQYLDYANNLLSNLVNTTYYDVSDTNSLGALSTSSTVLTGNNTTATKYISPLGITNWQAVDLSGNQFVTNGDGTICENYYTGDSRFPGQTELLSESKLTTPGGFQTVTSISRAVALASPSDPLSVTSVSNLVTLNGNTFSSVYTASNRVSVATTPEGRQKTTQFDSLGRAVQVQGTGTALFAASYDSMGRLSTLSAGSASGAQQTALSYDSLGRLSLRTDPLGRSNAYSYDSAGHLSAFTLADGRVANLSYDAEGNLTSYTPPGRPTHSLQYNAVNLLTSYTPPAVNGEDDSMQYSYDNLRELTNVQFPDGQSLVFQWNADGDMVNLLDGDGPSYSFTYNPKTGRPAAVTASDGNSLSFVYDGVLLKKVSWSGAVSGTVAMEFNADSLISQETVNSSNVAFLYDMDGLLTSAGTLNLVHNALGFVASTACGQITDQRQFDDVGRMTNYAAAVAGSNIWSLALAYDPANRLTNRVEVWNGVSQTAAYSFDLGGHLTQVSSNGALAVTYTYDSNGNRLTRNSEDATYDDQDRVTSYNGAAYGWSPNGTRELAASGPNQTTYSYDLRGVLDSVGLPDGRTVEYVTDGFGRRIGKEINGVLQSGWLYDGGRIVGQLDANSNLVEQFVWGASALVPSCILAGTNTYRILADERGSVRFVVNAADGSIAQALTYDEFGRVLSDSNPGFQPFGFTGGLYDPDTGLVRFGIRDYDPQTGQWTGRDPAGFFSGQTSLYAYVNNDPLDWVDHTGAGPFSLKTRSGAVNNVYNALFDSHGGTKSNNDGQLAGALQAADQQVHDALNTGAKAAFAGQVAVITVTTLGAASSVTSLQGGAAVTQTAAGSETAVSTATATGATETATATGTETATGTGSTQAAATAPEAAEGSASTANTVPASTPPASAPPAATPPTAPAPVSPPAPRAPLPNPEDLQPMDDIFGL